MTYNDVADMADSASLKRRVTAAVAEEGILDPVGWLFPRYWQIVSQPGWDDAWASAVAGGNPDPGASDAVITDGMILSGVQAVVADEAPAGG